jgi:putative ABC transport system permease protein
MVMPGYFQAMGIPILAGRDFSNTDDRGSPPVIILSQTAADTVFPGENPLGRQVAVDLGGDEPALFEVAGIVGDHRLTSLSSRVRLAMFFSYHQRSTSAMQLAIRTRTEPSSLLRPIQERLWELDRDIPLADARTMEGVLDSSVSGSRAITTVLGMFAAVALFLAAMGLYGVLAYFVTKRVHEIGIRVALGATARSVLRLVLQRGMALVILGLVLGVVGALGATRLMEELLFQTNTTDPGTFTTVAAFFVITAFLACLLPAWNAVSVDPVEAFRAE